MKTIITLAALAAFSTSAMALDPGCNPAKGNWVNAATQTCAVSDVSHSKVPTTSNPPELEGCDHEKPKSY